jgi:hypothetical protein
MSSPPRQRVIEQRQIEAFRRMTPAERVECCLRWTNVTYELARSAIRQAHSDWTGPQVDRELGRRITGIDVSALDWKRVQRQQEALERDASSSDGGRT